MLPKFWKIVWYRRTFGCSKWSINRL